MEISQYQVMYDVEDVHFWYVGMRAITTSILHKLSLKPHVKILDAGCGTGANMIFLKQYGSVAGIDISPLALRLCKKRGLKSLRHGSINKIPYPSNSFDLVTNFDVLGSKEVEEKQALSEFYRILKPGGYLLIRVSAYHSLYSKHDKVVHTARRYTCTTLIEAMQKQSFKINRSTYANTILFPLLALRRIWQKRFIKIKISDLHESDVTPLHDLVNKFGLFPMLFESWIIRYVNLPFGLSLIVVARKPFKSI